MRKYNKDGIPSNLQFVQVVGEDGTFYDLVRGFEVSDHITLMTGDGYYAQIVRKKQVPPCIFRDFSVGLSGYYDAAYMGGTDFYFAEEVQNETN